ncbi:hypothetical protein HGA64_02355 [Candidatus Falkowbacteria bacterium]|nr:hypothetical protein [Candidatus Falkowbacteria bacterium]
MFDENIKKDVITSLGKLGLTDKEAAVYLALLSLGEVGSSKIISHTALHGQYVYQALDSLESKGLAQHVIKRGRKKFSAKSPNRLASLIDQQKRLADNVVTQLQSMIVLPPAQQFEIFQGEESFIAHEFELLDLASEHSELLVIGGEGDNFYQVMGHELIRYEKIRSKKNIKIKYLGSEAQRETLSKSKSDRRLFEYKLLPGMFTGLVNTNIWSNCIGLNLFGEPVTAFVMKNQQIADSYKQFFNALWQMAK